MKINLKINKEKFKEKLGVKDGQDGKDGLNGKDGNKIFKVNSFDFAPTKAQKGDIMITENTGEVYIYE